MATTYTQSQATLPSGDIIKFKDNVSGYITHNSDVEAGSVVYTVNADWIQGKDVDALIDLIYPVGSIYMSMSSTSPETLFGVGTWVQITGRFLLGTGYPGNNTDDWWGTIKYPQTWNAPAGSTGGEDFHTLTISEMPSHNHTNNTSGRTTFTDGGSNDPSQGGGTRSYQYLTIPMSNTGGDAAHNNMPPYLSVYMWKRTA